MKKFLLGAGFVIMLSFVNFGCQSQDEVVEENVAEKQSKEAVQETREATQEVREAVTVSKTEFKQEAETKLNELERGIDQLEAKAANVATASKDEFNEMINDLKEKKTEVNAKLEQLEAASAATWEEVKSRVTAAVNDLQNTYDRAASRFQ